VTPYAVVPCPLDRARALAEALDLALASAVVSLPQLEGTGPCVEHERLTAVTAGGKEVPVTWLRVGGVDHVVGLEGRALAQAWSEGHWERRHAILAALRGEADPAEADLDTLP